MRKTRAVICALAVLPAGVAFPAGVHGQSAAPTRRLSLAVGVPHYPLAVAGTRWGRDAHIILTISTPLWTVGKALTTAPNGSFLVGLSGQRPCVGFSAQARDRGGHVRILAVSPVPCPLHASQAPLHLAVLQGIVPPVRPPVVVGPNGPQQVALRIGARLTFRESGDPAPFNPHADAAYLPLLQQSTARGPCTAVCSSEVVRSWTFVAVRAGHTVVDLSPACRELTPPCERPDVGIAVTIAR